MMFMKWLEENGFGDHKKNFLGDVATVIYTLFC